MLGLLVQLVVSHQILVLLGILVSLRVFLALVQVVDKLVYLIELAGVVLGCT